MKLTDIHVHLWDKDWFPPGHRMRMAVGAANRRWPVRDPMEILPRVGQGVYDPDGSQLIRDMEDLGIDIGIIMVMDWGMFYVERGEPDSPLPIREINRHILSLREKYPGKVYGFAGVDPRRKGGLQLFETAVKEWGAVGYKPYPPTGYYADDPRLNPYYEKCIEYNLPVLIHTGGSGSTGLHKYGDPDPVGEVAVRFPELKIIMAHTNLTSRFESGLYWRAIQIAASVPNIHLELTWQGSGALEDGNIAQFWHVLDVMRNTVGAHRIIFGTDNPHRGSGYQRTRRWCEIFKNLPEEAAKYGVTFTQDEQELICHANTERLLGI